MLDWLTNFLVNTKGWIVFLFGTFLVGVMVIEDGEELLSLSPIHYLELFLFVLLLVVLTIAMRILTRAVAEQSSTARLIELRHQLSLTLASTPDFGELVDRVIRFPMSISPEVKFSSLLIYHPDQEHFEQAGELNQLDEKINNPFLSEADGGTHNCLNNTLNHLRQLQVYTTSPIQVKSDVRLGYCLPLTIGLEPVASLHLILSPGVSLTEEQSNILNSVGTDIAISVKSALQQQRLTEIKTTQAALSERNNLYQDLHDVLSQNLGFLHLKLDEYAYYKNEAGRISPDKATIQNSRFVPLSDLERMRDVATVSYEIVRGTLNTLHASTSPYLSGLLNHQSSLATADVNFVYRFNETGQPQPLSSYLLNNIYFICREAINNVAKHSNATLVEGKLTWDENDLTIKITDNGQGFDPQSVSLPDHYGLSIMNERAKKMHGRLQINSDINAGARVKIWIPLNVDNSSLLASNPDFKQPHHFENSIPTTHTGE